MTRAIREYKEAISDLNSENTAAMNNFTSGLGNSFDSITDKLKELNKESTAFKITWESVAENTGNVLLDINAIFRKILEGIGWLIGEFVKIVIQTTSDLAKTVYNFFTNPIQFKVDFSQFMKSFEEAKNNIKYFIASIIEQIFGSLYDGFSKALGLDKNSKNTTTKNTVMNTMTDSALSTASTLMLGPASSLNLFSSMFGSNSFLGNIFKNKFAEGGLVPGYSGQPIPALVHGGETVLPVGVKPMNISININNPSVRSDADIRSIAEEVKAVLSREQYIKRFI